MQPVKPVLVYTMTAGLGDVVVLDSLACTLENGIPDSICHIFHRNNPHTALWSKYCRTDRYVNVYRLQELYRGIARLRQYRAEGRMVFGLQMAPGSLQGFVFYCILKKIGAIDFIVDFNLVNADIITPPRGTYIFDRQVNQLCDLLNVTLKVRTPRPVLPFMRESSRSRASRDEVVVGIHPWSRRGHLDAFVWPMDNWLEIIRTLLEQHNKIRIIVFGRDAGFADFRTLVEKNIAGADRVAFEPSSSILQLAATIRSLDLLITVNTGAVHVAYALEIPMLILSGPSLDLWNPEGDAIVSVTDSSALFPSADRSMNDRRFSRVGNIPVADVANSLDLMLQRIMGKAAAPSSGEP